jgi:hypothetical protein
LYFFKFLSASGAKEILYLIKILDV